MTAERAESMDIRDLTLVVRHTGAATPCGLRHGRKRRRRESARERGGQGVLQLACAGARSPPARHRAAKREARRPADHHDAAHGGPSVRGLPGAGAHGFIPIDKHCGVRGTGGRVFAAGDAANYPIKHGGLGAQMADAAAAAIAVLPVAGEGSGVQPGDPRQAPDGAGSGLHERSSARRRELRVGGLRHAPLAGR